MNYKKIKGIILIIFLALGIEIMRGEVFSRISDSLQDIGLLPCSNILESKGFAYQLTNLHLPLIFKNYCPDYYDNFSYPNSLWPIVDDAIIRTEFLNGEYRVYFNQNGKIVYIYAGICRRENYVMEVDMRWASSSMSAYSVYGVLFGRNDENYFYSFIVRSDIQEYILALQNLNGYIYYIKSATYSPAISYGSAVNRLKVIRHGSNIAIYANGILLGSFTDSSIAGLTRYGIISSCPQNMITTDARFDNFRVSNSTIFPYP
jgi:hypothetical protein